MYLLILLISGAVCFALHLSGTSFPSPMSPKEEAECIKGIHDGDEGCRKKLVERNLRLVAHVVKKYYSIGCDEDDLISIGSIGLIKAVSTFDGTKGSKFATYAARCIENEILMYFRNKKKSAQDVYISDPIDTDKNGNALTLMDVVADDECIYEKIENGMMLEKLREFVDKELEGRERNVIIMRYGLDGRKPLAQRQTAQRLGISRSYVSRIEKKAITVLRKKFAEAGEK